jgi:hypothetical protein
MAKSEDNEKALREILYVIDDQYTILKTLFKRSDLNIVTTADDKNWIVISLFS